MDPERQAVTFRPCIGMSANSQSRSLTSYDAEDRGFRRSFPNVVHMENLRRQRLDSPCYSFPVALPFALIPQSARTDFRIPNSIRRATLPRLSTVEPAPWDGERRELNRDEHDVVFHILNSISSR